MNHSSLFVCRTAITVKKMVREKYYGLWLQYGIIFHKDVHMHKDKTFLTVRLVFLFS